ncbi:hypothetical protein [Flagellimonas myxillae]|uniref:hypothetical protein n=1 Tax=Flagellimonas myxillae TaxID=2942214 RepID=UPI00201E9DEF|nr:hypothetical protein [Muricauda myxillae]MCL6265065.1 hypothetical protein [Muricauda myxillae]
MELKTNSNKKSKVKLKGLDKTQVGLLKNNQMSLSAFVGLLSGSAGTMAFGYAKEKFATRDESESEEDIDEVDLVEDPEMYEYEVPTSVEFADTVSDEMSFGEAFKTAREELGQGGFFTWRGQHYNTYTKEEWDAFTDEDKSTFFKVFRENTDFENGEARRNDDSNGDEANGHQENPETENEEKPSSEEANDEREEVALEEIGTDEEIIDGLNDGEAYAEEDNFGEDIT